MKAFCGNLKNIYCSADHIFHMQGVVLPARAILFPYFSHNAPLYMAFISCDIMVMHFNVLSFIAESSQLFMERARGKYLFGVDSPRIYDVSSWLKPSYIVLELDPLVRTWKLQNSNFSAASNHGRYIICVPRR